MDSVLTARIGADLSDLKSKMNEAHGVVGNFQEKIAEIGTAIAGAFAAEKIFEFGKACLEAGAEAVDVENKLLVALHGREDIQKRLLSQAEDMAGRTLFADDDIIKQQALLAALGKNESQIKKIIEAAVQLSAATGTELGPAVEALNKSYEGMDRGLKAIDPSLRGLTQAQLMHGDAVQMVIDKYKGMAEAQTDVGSGPAKQAVKEWGELMEELGKFALPAVNSGMRTLTDTIKGLRAEDVHWWEKLGAVFTAGGLANVGIMSRLPKAESEHGAGSSWGEPDVKKVAAVKAIVKKSGPISAGLIDSSVDYSSGLTGFSGAGIDQAAIDMAKANYDEMKAADEDYSNFMKDELKARRDVQSTHDEEVKKMMMQYGNIVGSQTALAIAGEESFAMALENSARSVIGNYLSMSIAKAIFANIGDGPFGAFAAAAAAAAVSSLFANLGTSHFTPSLNSSYGATRGLANGAAMTVNIQGTSQVQGSTLNTWWSNTQQQNTYTMPPRG